MDLTPEEREGMHELLALVRQIGEDFSHEYYGRVTSVAPRDRLVYLARQDSSEVLLSSLAESVALLDDTERFAAALASFRVAEYHNTPFDQEYEVRIASFHWACERCFGAAFTPAARSAQRKLADITRAAMLSGLLTVSKDGTIVG